MRSLPIAAWRTLACLLLLPASVLAREKNNERASYSGKGPPLLLHEIWVPADALDPILSRYPRTVSLRRDELLTLLHDAHAADPAAVDPAAAPPERAVLRQARFDARLVSGPEASAQVRVEAELQVEVFSDQWAEVPLGLSGVVLGTAEMADGQPASLRRSRADVNPPAALLLQGRGVHRLRLGFLLPVATRPDGSALTLPAVEGIGEFTLHLPAGTRADSTRGCAVQPDGAGVLARVALRALAGDRLTWRTPPPSSDAAAVVLQEGGVHVLVGESAVTIRQEVTLRTALGRLPGETRLALPPEARAVRVEGAAATRWDLGADGLRVVLDASGREDTAEAAFRVLYELPLTLDPGGAVKTTAVPLLEAAGVHRVAGRIVVRHGPGVQVRRVEPGAVATPVAGENTPGFVTAFSLGDLPVAGRPTPPVALTLEARRAAARFSVDADARADFQRDDLRLQRTLTFHVEEGELFTARVALPKGETFLDLQPAGGSARPDWRQEGDALVLTWNAGLREGSKTVLVLGSRADLAAPKTGAPVEASLAAALVPGAERLTGYVAVASALSLRLVITGGEERLERRDGRTTPVTGDVAWFYRDDFHLALRVERRATEMEARFTGYALPLAGAVEIHGQLDYHFLYAGVETVRIRVPAGAADAFFFTGPRIAERRRDGDVWTIRFQGEQTGDYALGVQATIPTPANKDDAEHFHFRLPTVAPLDTARWSGVWAVEANTDTEIGFHAVGASEVDTLRAPTLAGYQPRRRVIGVFEFLGNGAAEATVDLDGVRHPAAGVAAGVVDSLTLETFASTSGVSRHRATLRARTAGDGFFDLRLPDGAALWSLTRDGELIKPVGGPAGELRVELPGGRDPSAASTVVAIYETPGQAWTTSGRRTLAAPRFDPGVPVVESRWTLHVPDGFDYRVNDASLGAVPAEMSPASLLLPQIGLAFGHAMQWACYYPQSLWAGQASAVFSVGDAAASARGLPGWMVAQSNKTDPSPIITELDAGPVLGEPVQKLILPKEDKSSPSKAVGKDLPHAGARRDTRKAHGEATAAIDRKLETIVIPQIDFHDTALADAIEFLRQESRRLDPDLDPELRGVNIFLKLPAPTTPADAAIPGLPTVTGPAASTRITLTMSRLPLLEALRYVAQQAGMKVKVEPYAVSIVPLSEVTDTLVTQEYEIPPGFMSSTPPSLGGGALSSGATAATASPAASQRQDARTFLEANGVTFPPGASAIYLPSTGKLVVRNTQDNLDLVDSLRQGAGEPAAPPPPADHLVLLDGRQLTNEQIKEAETRSAIFGTDPLSTAEFQVSPGFLANPPEANTARDVTGTGSVTIQRQDARSFLEAQGFSFPPGASVTYLPGTGKLVLRNTPDAIKQMAGLLTAGNRSGTFGLSANATDTMLFNRTGRTEARVAGLLPIRLDLPANGITYQFAGGGEPGTLDFHYTDWRAAARWRWVWLTLGALAFLCFAAGWAHPWRRTLWVALTLTFWPLVVAPSALTPCNALLAGWLWAVLGWGVTRFLRRRRFAATVVLCAAALLPTRAHAVPASPPPPPETVIVPYDAARPAAAQQPARYYLPYERFLELWDAAKRHRRPAAPAPPPGGERSSLNTARYDARVAGDTLEINAALDFQTFGEGWVSVKLKFDGAAVGALTLDGAPASLSNDGDLWVGTPGAHHVAAALRLPADQIADGRDLAWSVPPTAATLVTLLLPRAGLRAEIHSNAPGGGTVEETGPAGRRYLASAGGTTAIRLRFRDAPPPAPETGQPALARIDARLVAGARQETVRSEIKFLFPGRTQNRFTVYLDPSLTLTNLDAPGVQAWHLATGGDRQTLDLTLSVAARDAYALSLEADRPLSAETVQRRTFPRVSALAGRVEQTAALLTDGALEIVLPDGPPAGARRTEFATPAGEGRVFGAFVSDGSPALVYSVGARAEKRTAHVNYFYQVGRGKIEWAASVRLASGVGGLPIQTADLRLPAGAAVQAVAGEAVRQWWRDGDRLSLRFQTGTPGEVSLVVYLVQPLDHNAPARCTLRPLTVVGFAETDGEAIVAADRSGKVGLTLPTGARAQELSEIDPGTAAGEFQVKLPLERQRAFRYRSPFEVGVTLETLPVLWQAQVVTRATVGEGTVALATRVNVEVRQGALDALEFTLPAGLAEASVSGPDVREAIPAPAAAGQDRRTYRVLFQNPVYGGSEAAFTVGLELPLGPGSQAALPDLRFPGGRAASAFLLVENASAGEMTLEPRGLDPAIEKDVPFLPAQIVAGTRFFRVPPGVPWSLGVAVANLEKTAGRAALVAYAELTSTLRADGEEWHRATYRLQNRRLQFLPVELPTGMDFIGARVAGESVRVDAGPGGKGQPPSLLVPLLKTRPGELSYDVELVYHRRAPGPGGSRSRRTWEHWRMADPRLPGIPVEKTLWNVFLPPDARLLSSGGNLEPVVAALNRTEKLESALSDLRNLSATYQSRSATRQEQQLALSNFNSLATAVKREARPDSGRKLAAPGGSSALFKQLNEASQGDVIDRKQNSIQRELESLSAANVAVQQTPWSASGVVAGSVPSAGGGALDSSGGAMSTGQTSAAGGPDGKDRRNGDFDGYVQYGSPLRSTDNRFNGTLQLQPPGWRDNRAETLDQNRANVSGSRDEGLELAPKKKGQLALNDSVTVDLPPQSPAEFDLSAKDEQGAAKAGEGRLSTARAGTSPAAAKPAAAPAPQTNVQQPAREPVSSPAVPAAPGVDSPASRPPLAPAGTGAGGRIESLRSVGRISLAVNFPQEGQVYHFKKLKADARLTLWSVRPAPFARLGWLTGLAALLAAGGLVRWAARRRSERRQVPRAAAELVA